MHLTTFPWRTLSALPPTMEWWLVWKLGAVSSYAGAWNTAKYWLLTKCRSSIHCEKKCMFWTGCGLDFFKKETSSSPLTLVTTANPRCCQLWTPAMWWAWRDTAPCCPATSPRPPRPPAPPPATSPWRRCTASTSCSGTGRTRASPSTGTYLLH